MINFRKILDVFSTLILRGGGAGVAVLFTIMVARYLPTEEASRFFLLFNISVIAAVCFRWGLDEVIVRRIAQTKSDEVKSMIMGVLFMSYRRVMLWLIFGFLVLLFYTFFFTDFLKIDAAGLFFSILSASFLALSACAARVIQGRGKTNLATFLLNIIIPSLLLCGLFLLITIKDPTALDLMIFYLFSSLVVFLFSVLNCCGNPTIGFKKNCSYIYLKEDRSAANKLGLVVFSQQILIWTALLIIPLAYGEDVYKAFVVIQKIATLISLVMLAINFTFSRSFALMYAEQDFSGIRKVAKYSIFFIIGVGVFISLFLLVFYKPIFYYIDLESGFYYLLFFLLIGQIFFSVSAFFSIILSMARDDVFLFKSQGIINLIGSICFLVFCFIFNIEIVSLVFVFCYLLLSFLLGFRVYAITKVSDVKG